MALLVPLTFLVPTIGQYYGLDPRTLWIPPAFYSIWVVYTAIVSPRLKFRYQVERSTVERIRGWSYVATLPIALSLNGILVYLLSKTPYVFVAVLFMAPIVGLLLSIVDASVIMSFFPSEIECLNKSEKHAFVEMLIKAGGASIWGSWSILILNSQLAVPKSLAAGVSIASLTGAVLMFAYSLYRNTQSSRLAATISESMVDSKWLKRFNAIVKKNRRK